MVDKGFARTMSGMERLGLQEALDAVLQESRQLREEGLSRHSFFLGILNLIVTTFVLAKWPYDFWLLYPLKCCILIPLWFQSVVKVYNGGWFIVDFCWVSSVLFGAFGVASFFEVVPAEWRVSLYLTFYCIALGPLGWAGLLLHNGMVFHSVEKITSMFIHVTPTLVCWTVVVYNEEVTATWPGRFPTTQELEGVTMGRLVRHGLFLYVAWLVIHSLWLLTVGFDFPRRGVSTVFGCLYERQNLAKHFQRATGLTSLRSHAAIYLVIHCGAVQLSFLSPVICWKVVEVHTLFAVVQVVMAAWNGASYYDYHLKRKYPKAIEKVLSTKQH